MSSNSKSNTPKEIILNEIRPIISRTDLRGIIISSNDYFSEISGYSSHELLGAPHNIIRHPDMPKVIFKWMWQRLRKNQDILAVVKNRTKSGDYYWVTTHFETKYNPLSKEPVAYLALRKAAPRDAIKKVSELYKELKAIEDKDGVIASEAYLVDFLKKQNKDYDSFIEDLVNYKGVVSKFFNSVRKMLS